MDANTNNPEARISTSTAASGLPEEAISKIHNAKPNERLMLSAAAFLRRMAK